jgi:hypothetical protein
MLASMLKSARSDDDGVVHECLPPNIGRIQRIQPTATRQFAVRATTPGWATPWVEDICSRSDPGTQQLSIAHRYHTCARYQSLSQSPLHTTLRPTYNVHAPPTAPPRHRRHRPRRSPPGARGVPRPVVPPAFGIPFRRAGEGRGLRIEDRGYTGMG